MRVGFLIITLGRRMVDVWHTNNGRTIGTSGPSAGAWIHLRTLRFGGRGYLSEGDVHHHLTRVPVLPSRSVPLRGARPSFDPRVTPEDLVRQVDGRLLLTIVIEPKIVGCLACCAMADPVAHGLRRAWTSRARSTTSVRRRGRQRVLRTPASKRV
jgi:hypothetical protein